MIESLNEQSSSWLRFRSELFAIRVWRDGSPGEDSTWRGRLQHVASGETREFGDWDTFIAGLTELSNQYQGVAR